MVAIVPLWRMCASLPCVFLKPLLTQLFYIFGINPDMFALLYHSLCAAQNVERIIIGQCIEFFFVAMPGRKIYHRERGTLSSIFGSILQAISTLVTLCLG